jgi:hypothetical protein
MVASQLTEFDRGWILGQADAGKQTADIVRDLKGKRGIVRDRRQIQRVVAKAAEEPGWAGRRAEGSGRPRMLTEKLDKEIVALVFKEAGSAKVTAKFLKKRASGTLLHTRNHTVFA